MNFPHYAAYIDRIANQDENSRQLMNELDEELRKNELMRAKEEVLQAAVEKLEFFIVLIKNIAEEHDNLKLQREKEAELAKNCYVSTLELSNMIKNLDISKIPKYDVLQKQVELEKDWRFKEPLYKRRYEQHVEMENRNCVRNLRALQAEYEELQQQNEQIQRNIAKQNTHWNKKIKEATQERNQSIIKFVTKSKEVEILRGKLSLHTQQHTQMMPSLKPFYGAAAAVAVMKSNQFERFPNIAQFFDKFNESPNSVASSQLRSILNSSSNDAAAPAAKKQVRFLLEPNISLQKSNSIIQYNAPNYAAKSLINNENNSTATTVSNKTKEPLNSKKENVSDNVTIMKESIEYSSSIISSQEDENMISNDHINKPIILENILLKTADNLLISETSITEIATNNDDDVVFKSPNNLQTQNTSISMNLEEESATESVPESATAESVAESTINSATELISNKRENVKQTKLDSFKNLFDYENNKERHSSSSPNILNFQMCGPSDDFFLDLNNDDGNIDNKNSYL